MNRVCNQKPQIQTLNHIDSTDLCSLVCGQHHADANKVEMQGHATVVRIERPESVETSEKPSVPPDFPLTASLSPHKKACGFCRAEGDPGKSRSPREPAPSDKTRRTLRSVITVAWSQHATLGERLQCGRSWAKHLLTPLAIQRLPSELSGQ